MRRVFSLLAVPVVLVVLVPAIGCRPTLDGAWQGSVVCPDDNFPVSLLLDEQEDGDLKGTVYIEQVPGVLGAEFIVKGTLDDGSYDPEDNTYSFDLQGDDDTPPEFSVELELDKEDPDEADGDVRQFNDEGTVLQECTITIDRLSVVDN
jgi:hypothetical protein